MGSYAEVYRRSIDDPDAFWGEQARLVAWFRKPKTVLDRSRPPFYRWYVGGTLNTCYNALDRHVIAGRGNRAALVCESAATGTRRTHTYAELLGEVAAFAGALRALGVGKGDRVVVYMPMIVEAVVAMLACARIGAVHAVVLGGSSAAELAVRIDDTRPVVIVTASCAVEPDRVVEYLPLLSSALSITEHQPRACVVLQRDECRAELVAGRDIDWIAAMAQGREDPAECVSVAATDPLYVLHTPGKTGPPKAVMRDTGGHAVALTWSMINIFDVAAGQVWWAVSDVGRVVGHSYIVYAPLLAGATSVLLEGPPVRTPDAATFWRVAAEHGVEALFTAPAAIRAIREQDPDGELLQRYDLSRLKTLFSAGELLDPDTYAWASEKLGVPVVDNWWQTETGWPIVASPRGLEVLPIKTGSSSLAMPGYDVRILDERGNPLARSEPGAICLRLPLPPGTLPTLWENDDGFLSTYLDAYDGYYLSGDTGFIDEDGYVHVMGRMT